jgi:hypothetical protein
MTEFRGDEDTHTEVTTESWGSRIGSSLGGIVFGILLIIASFPTLFWNEGRAVKTAQSLEEGGGAVVSVAVDRVDPQNEGKLVHLTGLATTDEILADPVFGISGNAIQLNRSVKMYQWHEKKEQKKEKKVGGKEVTTTTYNYVKDWSSTLINSANFKKQREHENPARMPYKGEIFKASKVTLGAFSLPQAMIGRISDARDVELTQSQIPASLRGKAQALDGDFYMGNNPAAPEIGDITVSFRMVSPTNISIIAGQSGNSFAPYKTSVGREIDILKTGTHTAASMFEAAQESNALWTWILRLVGFVVMFIGFKLVFKPLVVIADVLPFLGGIVSVGTGLVSFLIAGPLSLVTIAIAWIFYRPLLGIVLLVVAAGGLAAIKFLPKKS